VQIGVITYSYRQMPDQSAETTLKYILDSGINAVELMDTPAELFAGRPAAPQNPAARQGGAGGAGGARAAGGGLPGGGRAGGTPCVPGQGPAPGEGARAGGGGRGGAGGGQRAEPTPEQLAFQQAQQQYQVDLKKWRTTVSMDKWKALKKMYNDAGVTMYAYKSDAVPKNANTTDEEYEYIFTCAAAVGANHTTMELPNPGEAGTATLKRMAQFAEKHKIYVAFHTHGQGSMTAFDEAMAISKWNMMNVDLGHYVAAGNVGGTPLQFLEKHHARIASFHLKDRNLPINCGTTVPFGTGDGQIKEILQLVKKNKWTFPATIELEYAIPQGSDAVQETRKCVEYARACLVEM